MSADVDDFARWSAAATAWSDNYLATLRDRPVRPNVVVGDVAAKLPQLPPEHGEPMDDILRDFDSIIVPGMTHWQHPGFFAYFPTSAAVPAMIAEQLATTLCAQTMLWQTSPAATELEQRVVDWLRHALGLPGHFKGVLHDTATTATFSAVLTMRERALDWQGLTAGLGGKRLRIYASDQVHSSIDKAVRLSGIGQDNLVKIAVGDDLGMDANALQAAISGDLAAGYTPAGVIVCVGGTAVGAIDPVRDVIKVAKAHDLYIHVDAAWAGNAMICNEFRHLWAGAEGADSIIFNPYKWLGAVSDCSVQFLADPTPQVRTLGLRPDYLVTQGDDEVTNFNEWTIPLGRRFRALKLWFLLRAYGLNGLRAVIRNQVAWIRELEAKFDADANFTVTSRAQLALFSFRYTPAGGDADKLTPKLLEKINRDGRIYLTQTNHNGQFVIRVSNGSFHTTREDVLGVYGTVREIAKTL